MVADAVVVDERQAEGKDERGARRETIAADRSGEERSEGGAAPGDPEEER